MTNNLTSGDPTPNDPTPTDPGASDQYRAQLADRFDADTNNILVGLGLADDPAGAAAVDVGAVPWLCDLIDAGRDLPLHAVPRSLGVRLRSLIHDAPGPAIREEPTKPPIEIAHLQSDSRRERELVGVRGGNADSWTLMFRSQLADVVMGVSVVSPAELRIAGQVLVHDGQQRQFSAELAGSGPINAAEAVLLTDTGDSFGRFNFGRVPLEELTLVLSDGVNDIVATLDLGDEDSS